MVIYAEDIVKVIKYLSDIFVYTTISDINKLDEIVKNYEGGYYEKVFYTF